MKKILALAIVPFVAFSLMCCAPDTGSGGSGGDLTGGGGGGGTGEQNTPPDDQNTSGGSDAGSLSVADTYAWTGDYPATEFVLKYSKGDNGEKLTYEYDDTLVSVDETKHTVTALKDGVATVRIHSDSFDTEFKVICETINKDTDDKRYDLSKHANGDRKGWDARVNGFDASWRSDGNPDSTTLFIGDSFFDTGFWKSFYGDYAGYDALCWGIGGTTTYTWETITDALLYKLSPKNIVMHCGTNSVYDLKQSADSVTSSLERTFTLMHDRMPDTKMYWLNIPKRYPGEAEKEAIAEETNARFAEWAEGRTWLTVIDLRSKLKIDKVLQDGLHPNADGYEVIIKAVADSGIKINKL